MLMSEDERAYIQADKRAASKYKYRVWRTFSFIFGFSFGRVGRQCLQAFGEGLANCSAQLSDYSSRREAKVVAELKLSWGEW